MRTSGNTPVHSDAQNQEEANKRKRELDQYLAITRAREVELDNMLSSRRKRRIPDYFKYDRDYDPGVPVANTRGLAIVSGKRAVNPMTPGVYHDINLAPYDIILHPDGSCTLATAPKASNISTSTLDHYDIKGNRIDNNFMHHNLDLRAKLRAMVEFQIKRGATTITLDWDTHQRVNKDGIRAFLEIMKDYSPYVVPKFGPKVEEVLNSDNPTKLMGLEGTRFWQILNHRKWGRKEVAEMRKEVLDQTTLFRKHHEAVFPAREQAAAKSLEYEKYRNELFGAEKDRAVIDRKAQTALQEAQTRMTVNPAGRPPVTPADAKKAFIAEALDIKEKLKRLDDMTKKIVDNNAELKTQIESNSRPETRDALVRGIQTTGESRTKLLAGLELEKTHLEARLQQCNANMDRLLTTPAANLNASIDRLEREIGTAGDARKQQIKEELDPLIKERDARNIIVKEMRPTEDRPAPQRNEIGILRGTTAAPAGNTIVTDAQLKDAIDAKIAPNAPNMNQPLPEIRVKR